MHDLLLTVVAELKGWWRFRWMAMAAAWLVCLGGWLYVYGLPDSYESHATVYVDTNSPLRSLLKNLTIKNDVLDRAEQVATALSGRTQLEKIARETDLHLRADSPRAMDWLIAGMRDRITIIHNARKDPNLFTISYRDIDLKTAQSVVSALLNTFVGDALGASREGAQKARAFLHEEIRELETDLILSEQILVEFKKENVGRMPGEGGGYFARLQSEMSELEETQSALRLANRKRDTLRQQLMGKQPTIVAAIGPQSDLDHRIAQNQSRLEELQLRFTNLHPDVVATKAAIEQLQAQKQRELDELLSAGGSGIASNNPVFQNIQIELTNVNVEIAALREKESTHNMKIAELRELVDILPEVEAELSRLTRDYDIKQSQYRALRQRLEIAELSESAEQSEEAKFRIIDPPTLPDAPVAPNRPVLLAIVLFAGLGVGGGVAFLANQLRPVFNDTNTLNRITALPVLGSIQILRTAERRQRRIAQIGAFGAALVVLGCIFAVVFLLQESGSRLVHTLI